MEKFAEDLTGNLSDYLFFLRLDRPIVQDLPSVKSELIKMALYADRWQQPVHLQKINIIPSGIMTVKSERLGEVLKSPSYVTRTLEFNTQTKAVDLKDKHGHVEFSSRRPFTIVRHRCPLGQPTTFHRAAYALWPARATGASECATEPLWRRHDG